VNQLVGRCSTEVERSFIGEGRQPFSMTAGVAELRRAAERVIPLRSSLIYLTASTA
jgi:hypothetical protein